MISLKDHVEVALLLAVGLFLTLGFGVIAGPDWLGPAIVVAAIVLMTLDGAFAQWREADRLASPGEASRARTLADGMRSRTVVGYGWKREPPYPLKTTSTGESVTFTHAEVLLAIAPRLALGLLSEAVGAREPVEDAFYSIVGELAAEGLVRVAVLREPEYDGGGSYQMVYLDTLGQMVLQELTAASDRRP